MYSLKTKLETHAIRYICEYYDFAVITYLNNTVVYGTHVRIYAVGLPGVVDIPHERIRLCAT